MAYKLSKQNSAPKVLIRRDLLHTRNDFQKLLGDINWMCPTIGLSTQELSNLFQFLQDDPNLNSPRQLTAETGRELAQVEQNLHNAHVDRSDLTKRCILIISPSNRSLLDLLCKEIYFRMDILSSQSKKLKIYIEKPLNWS